jgi:hypothetical protein
MMDLRHVPRRSARAGDFIVSGKLVSPMRSQLSENRNPERVFEVLFSSGGPEIHMRPITDHTRLGADNDMIVVLAKN